MKKRFIIFSLLTCSLPIFAENPELTDTLDIRRTPCATAVDFLEGRVSGLWLGDRSAADINLSRILRIRGVNSIRTASEPTWVVDGVITSMSLALYSMPFNVEDIESIDVVKDMSAASSFGSKGANGVIVIRTKHPSREGFRTSFKSSAGLWGGHPGFSNTLSAGGATGKSSYFISGFYDRKAGNISGNYGNSGGLRASFETRANSVVWFGMNTSLALDSTSAPVEESWASDYDKDSDGKKITAGAYLGLNFTPSLSLRLDAGLDFNDRTGYEWNGPTTPEGALCNGLAVVTGRTRMNYNAAANLLWNRYFAKHHNVRIDGTLECSGWNSRENTLEGSDFMSYNLRAKGINVSGSNPDIRKYEHEYFNRAASVSAQYSYRGFIWVSGRLRWDMNPRYADSGRLYRSFNSFFDIRNAFWSESDVLSGLRLGVGYGEAGGEDYVPYGNYSAYLASYPVVDKNLEMFYDGACRLFSAEWNASLDASFLSGRISLKASVYDKKTSDSFTGYCFGAPVSASSHYWGYTDGIEQFQRKSIVSNRGLEADMEIGLIKNTGLDWSVYLSAARNINHIEAVDPYDEIGVSDPSGFVGNANVAGRAALSFYGYPVDESNCLIDVTGDGRLDDRDCRILASSVPEFTYSFGTTVRAGRFAFDFLATAATGYSIADFSKLRTDVDWLSKDCLFKGDNVNFRRISVSYNLPTKKVKWLQSLTFAVSADNVGKIGGYSPKSFNPAIYGLSIKLDF